MLEFFSHTPPFFCYPYKLNHRQLLLNSPGCLLSLNLKYTAPLPRTLFPVPWALSTPPGHRLLQEASTVLKDGSGALCAHRHPVPQRSPLVILLGQAGFIVLTWVSLCCCPRRTMKGKCVERRAGLGLHIHRAHLHQLSCLTSVVSPSISWLLETT